MIQNRLHDKDNDIQGLKKQSSALLNCAWEKGYCAGHEDGYATGREAFKPSNELNEESVIKMARQGKWKKIFENPFTNGYVCPFCGHKIQVTEHFLPEVTECEVCGADMREESK